MMDKQALQVSECLFFSTGLKVSAPMSLPAATYLELDALEKSINIFCFTSGDGASLLAFTCKVLVMLVDMFVALYSCCIIAWK